MHGPEGLQQALKATDALRPGAATELDAATLEAIAGDAPSCELPRAQVRRAARRPAAVVRAQPPACRRTPLPPHTHTPSPRAAPAWSPPPQVEGQPLVDVIVASGMLPSKGEVRRMVKNGGVYLNNGKVTDDKKLVEGGDLIEGRLALVACGKKNKMLVRVQ